MICDTPRPTASKPSLPRELRDQSRPRKPPARAYYEFRAALMVQNNEGLTKTYNRFHDPNETSPEIQQAPRAARRDGPGRPGRLRLDRPEARRANSCSTTRRRKTRTSGTARPAGRGRSRGATAGPTSSATRSWPGCWSSTAAAPRKAPDRRRCRRQGQDPKAPRPQEGRRSARVLVGWVEPRFIAVRPTGITRRSARRESPRPSVGLTTPMASFDPPYPERAHPPPCGGRLGGRMSATAIRPTSRPSITTGTDRPSSKTSVVAVASRPRVV